MLRIPSTYFLSMLILGVLLLGFQSCKSNPQEAKKPNIILIVSDDQGWGDLGINGNPYVHTPVIDNLAKNGVQFSRFYVSPVCSPTRAELLTGRYHPRGGVYDTSQGGERLDLDETTIADLFKSNGYKTAAYGKWHNGSQPPYHPNNRGFDEYYGFASGHWGNYFDPMLERNGEVVKGKGFIIDDLTSDAMNFIDRAGNDPFFVYLAYNTPHGPMQVPDEWWAKYDGKPVDSTHRYSEVEDQDMTRAVYALSENIDWNIGRMIDKLESQNLLENTIIIYMSDNGPNGQRWNDGLKGIKGSTDEGGVRSPFIVYWKDTFMPLVIPQIAGAIDILPTLTDLANISSKTDKPLDGISLKPLLFGNQEAWPDRSIFSHWNGNVSLRNQKYILDKDDQLFDLEADPGQFHPISNPENPLYSSLVESKENWKKTVLNELDRTKEEVFPVGYSESKFTQLPARDALPHGTVERSNIWPNSSHFTNWTSTSDSITWNTDILISGDYKATIYYTCPESTVGSVLQLNQGNNLVSKEITEAHSTEFISVEYDRVPRKNSYEKDFKPLEIGVIHLDEGHHPIALKALKIKGDQFIEVRLLVLERVK